MRQQSKTQVSRRDAIRWSLTGAIGATLLGVSASSSESSGDPRSTSQSGEPLSTLDATVILGSRPVSRLPYQRLASGPALKTLVREELCTRNSAANGRRIGLATFGHLTDAHVLDAANPGRLSFLWQYFDFSGGYPSSGRFRPQDLLTVHVLDATVRKLNAVRFGPLSQRPLDCLVTTGDLTNSFALSELSAAVGVFKGGSATSHPTGEYEGVQDHGPAPLELSKSIWHPEPESSLAPPDDWKTLHGYPTVPGLLAAAVKPVIAQGSDFPWYIGVGNHDEAGRSTSDPISPKTDFVDTLRIGDRLPIRLPHGMSTTGFWNDVNRSSDRERRKLIASMPSRTVRSSKLRRPFSKAELMKALPNSGGGVQFGSGPDSQVAPYYTFDISPEVVGIMLNTASPDGSTVPVLDATQAQWLEEQLSSVSGKSYDAKGKLTTSTARDRLVVLFSHHPLSAFDKQVHSSNGSRPPLNRSAVLGLLSRYPNVIAWMNGHRHKHRVTPHKSKYEYGGFWEVTTASLIDYPQQSRIVELMDNRDGTLSIAATLVDHSAPEDVVYDGTQTSRSMAALSLELAINRPGLNRDEMTGRALDQNVDLILRKPF